VIGSVVIDEPDVIQHATTNRTDSGFIEKFLENYRRELPR